MMIACVALLEGVEIIARERKRTKRSLTPDFAHRRRVECDGLVPSNGELFPPTGDHVKLQTFGRRAHTLPALHYNYSEPSNGIQPEHVSAPHPQGTRVADDEDEVRLGLSVTPSP